MVKSLSWRCGAVLCMAAFLCGSDRAWGVLGGGSPAWTVLDSGEGLAASVKGGYGMLNGEARELVYDPLPSGTRSKVSELIWDLSEVHMLGLMGSVSVYDMVQLNCSYYTKLNEGSGEMEDYDWMFLGQDWSDWSHGSVKVQEAQMWDINATVPITDFYEVMFSALIGYKADSWKWKDSSREFIYSEYGFRDSVGSFGGANLINYEQDFTVPYIGGQCTYELGSVRLGAYFQYSFMVSAEDKDLHRATEVLYDGSFEDGEYIGYGLSVSFDVMEELFVSAAWEMQRIKELSGDVEQTYADGSQESFSDGGGLSHRASMLSLGAGWRF